VETGTALDYRSPFVRVSGQNPLVYDLTEPPTGAGWGLVDPRWGHADELPGPAMDNYAHEESMTNGFDANGMPRLPSPRAMIDPVGKAIICVLNHRGVKHDMTPLPHPGLALR